MRRLALATLLAAVAVAGTTACTHPPRPAVMADADKARKTPGAEEAAALAPEAFAHAEKLRRDAERAYRADDYAGAQFLSERAIAAYEHALVLARLARAAKLAGEANDALQKAEDQLAKTQAELERATAAADDLEARIKVARDALPITATSPTSDGQREAARFAAARSIALDARLLCTAAKLLGGTPDGLPEAEKMVADLDAQLASTPKAAPLDAATRARAQCLAALTAARRPAASGSTTGRADALLAELSAMGGLAPVRDDRGVVVTLRELFDGNELSSKGSSALTGLGRVAAAHAAFPIEVVVHEAKDAKGDALAREKARGEKIAKALVAAGAAPDKVHVEAAGGAHPVVDPMQAGERARNDRIEIVFVNPGG